MSSGIRCATASAPVARKKINILHNTASTPGVLDLGYSAGKNALFFRKPQNKTPAQQKEGTGSSALGKELIFLLGADPHSEQALVPATSFVIYQGHHGSTGARHADIILPSASYVEKNATFVNTEGRVQQTQVAAHPISDIRDDWRILKALCEHISPPGKEQEAFIHCPSQAWEGLGVRRPGKAISPTPTDAAHAHSDDSAPPFCRLAAPTTTAATTLRLPRNFGFRASASKFEVGPDPGLFRAT
jgi:hypothetical protein